MFISLAPWLRINVAWFPCIIDDRLHPAPGRQFWPENDRTGGPVIEFRVPSTFRASRKRWFAARKPGKLIQFPLRAVKKSVYESGAMIEPKT